MRFIVHKHHNAEILKLSEDLKVYEDQLNQTMSFIEKQRQVALKRAEKYKDEFIRKLNHQLLLEGIEPIKDTEMPHINEDGQILTVPDLRNFGSFQ